MKRLVVALLFTCVLGDLMLLDKKRDLQPHCKQFYKTLSPYDYGVQFRLDFENKDNDCLKFDASIYWFNPDLPSARCYLNVTYDTVKDVGHYSYKDRTKNFKKTDAPLLWKAVDDGHELKTYITYDHDEFTQKEERDSPCWLGSADNNGRLCYEVGYTTDSEDCGLRLSITADLVHPSPKEPDTTPVPPTSSPTPAPTTTTPLLTTVPALTRTWWFWTAVGGGGFLLCLLAAIVIFLVCWWRRRRKTRAAAADDLEAGGEPKKEEDDDVSKTQGAAVQQPRDVADADADAEDDAKTAKEITADEPSTSSSGGSQYLGVPNSPAHSSVRAKKKN